ncbi:hypothetical protein THAOC_22079 [Thalassiosira oceanica]|uniref:Prolyl endopeptidase n=1 Tax=Thalassiosira oceanica TaxID=159749 RepID=K0RZD3_THAOC|nr:hypothetical protein THAOC_22079 [Thalassiosira oceanica]|eukprot:EJK57839.1 hypothetical protein THAOC_22079 [Thalassiosira oceanica]
MASSGSAIRKAIGRTLAPALLLRSANAFSAGMAPPAASPAATAGDPHVWLEDVLGEKPLAWVDEVNKKCIEHVGDPKATGAYRRIKSVLDSKEKIPHAFRIGNGDGSRYYNFWQDADHVQGIWRRTSLESYKTKEPEWTTVLDLDALPPPTTGTAKTWVWHGSTLLDEGPDKPADRALIRLSPGGSDADTCREFDLNEERFVDPVSEDGFALPDPAKTRISYRSRDEVLVGTDFGMDGSTLTDSGYPRVVKSWRRGTPIEDAVVVFEGEQDDIAASMYAYHDRGHVHEFQLRSITFYTSKYFYRPLTVDGIAGTTCDEETTPFREVPIPEDAELGTFADMAMVTLRSDFEAPGGVVFGTGSLVTLPMSDLMDGDWTGAVSLFAPTPSRSLSGTTECRDYIILKLLEDVKTRLEFWRFDKSSRKWTRQDGGEDADVPVGQDVSVSPRGRDSSADNALWLFRDGYLVPDTMEMASAEDCCAVTEPVKAKPAMFDADGLIVEQRFAASKDGTKIPYFVMRREDVVMDGGNPVLLDAYGGFEISMTPGYSAGVGAGWLERGGCKVIANIRGGGEYGPGWHQAALKENRYKCFEDMEAVARDLIDSGLTCREKLACIGGSNGGLLVGNLITRPIASRLFGAAVCQVPLLDMKRYSHLLAGASWMGEYGNPDTDDWSFLRRHSPYHLLRHDILGKPEPGDDGVLGGATESTDAGWECPRTLFTTSTRDDRVHPGHARKMVASLLEEAGPGRAPRVLYWENTEGGHGGAADNSQRAYMWALTYNFLAKELGLEE